MAEAAISTIFMITCELDKLLINGIWASILHSAMDSADDLYWLTLMAGLQFSAPPKNPPKQICRHHQSVRRLICYY